jgi:hypothetical protein
MCRSDFKIMSKSSTETSSGLAGRSWSVPLVITQKSTVTSASTVVFSPIVNSVFV